MADQTPVAIAQAFIEAISKHDVDALCALMSEDHLFVDSADHRWQGRETMRDAWRGYFLWFPDYAITVEETYANGSVVVVLGKAGGTYAGDGGLDPSREWQVPAAFRAEVVGGLVKEWRVYADNGPARQAMQGGGG